MTYKVFPDYALIELPPIAEENYTIQGIELWTQVRKKHTDGLYYYILVGSRIQIETFEYERNKSKVTNEAMVYFLKEVYNAILFHVIDPDLKRDRDGTLIYVRDKDQRDERERIFSKKF